jgi:hypothetical protein
MARRGGRGSGGRIRPHERETDNSAILGADLEIQAAHSQGVRNTEQRGLNLTTKRNYRNRIKEMYIFFSLNYKEYYNVGVRKLSEAERVNLDGESFHWKNTHDLIYTGINVQMVKAFLAHKKQKANGNTSSHVQLRKYHDAILWGSQQAKQLLPRGYYDAIEKFLTSYRKETVDAKKEGKLDEQEADPITWSLFKLILSWAVDTSNFFVWTYSILQWNCMARSVNIGSLGFHNFRAGEDHIVCCYDDTKSDKTGEMCTDKHIYANPLEPIVCPFLALAVFFSLESLHLSETEKFFQFDGQTTAASQRYCGQLSELFKRNNENLKGYIRADHANSHGFCKGSATTATSGTTLPPPTSSIAARGEWSLGRILDIYWHFAEPGDHYLGRCLAGLSPNSEDFAILPPHFTVGNPMENERIREAMELMYGPLLQKWAGTKDSDPTAVLLKVLPSIVYHSEFLQSIIRRVPGHPFAGIPLLNDPALLRDLKELVTIEPSPHVSTATGIPPHVHHAKLTTSCLELCRLTLTEVKSMATDLKKAVCDAIESKAFENGIVTTQSLAEMLKVHHEQIDELITDRLKALQTSSAPTETATPTPVVDEEGLEFAPGTMDDADDDEEAPTRGPIVYRTYTHSGRFWHTPKTFVLPPRMKLDTGWKIWCNGIPCYQITDDETGQAAPIRPFRAFKNEMLPKHIRQNFCLHWRPIFEVMEACPGLDPADEDSFERGIAFLKTRVEYVFRKRRANPMQWELSTWSRHVRRSSIEKNGTDSDKAALPTETSRFNKPRKTGTLKRKRKQSDHRRRCRQPPRRTNAAVVPLQDDDSSSDSSSSNSDSSPGAPEPPESPRRSTLRSAARAAAKEASRKAEEEEKTDTEDEGAWGTCVLDGMIDALGTRKEVEKDIADHRRKRALALRQAQFSHADEDGNAVMITRNATRGYGASSRDPNYSENVRNLLAGGRQKGHCAVGNCDHPEMELLHKCTACKRFVHVLCAMSNNLQEDDCSYCSNLCRPT